MKYFSKLFSVVALIAVMFSACDKVDDLPSYANGSAPVLSSSATVFNSTAADSNSVALSFSWTYPKYSADSSTFKYVIEIAPTGTNFNNPATKVIIGKLNTSFLAKEINAILLGFGFAFNVAYDVDFRLLSSYGNNNEQYKSNVIKIKATPYVTPPKVALPASGKLFLVGDGTQGGWNNPVPVPTQEFAKIDSVTWGGVFNMNGGAEFLVLPVNGDWSNKYSIANKNLPGVNTGGDFGYNLNDNFKSPTTSGWYTIVLNFQTGKFVVTPYTGTLPVNLFIVGDATPGGWNNPVPVPSQQLTRLNSSVWQISLAFTGTGEYLLLPVNGSWSNKYAVADKNTAGARVSGPFGYNLNDNFPGPSTSGTKTLEVNFVTGRYKVTP